MDEQLSIEGLIFSAVFRLFEMETIVLLDQLVYLRHYITCLFVYN